ncbi:hypothetical protein DFH06DRAFT_1340184 [Mycena polygramma]|nr:hypothetical protein DFH06DRAFT_1340184 [Mycena polygramma]
MPNLRHSLAFLTDYRIGYSPQRPYPWRWTTPLALFILLTSTVLLTCVNIPLSAYEIVQEFTYFPNATVAPLPMSNIIPSFLRAPTADFSPQTLHVGDIFRLNDSLFSYTIVSAFDAANTRKQVTSFPYYNNPFSVNCDVTNMTASVNRTLGDSVVPYQYFGYMVSGYVTCSGPTVFAMTWGLPMMDDGLFSPQSDDFGEDLRTALYYGVLDEPPNGEGSVFVTVRPCCNCTGTTATTSAATLHAEAVNLLQPPCSTEPAQFIGLSGVIRNATALSFPWGYEYNWNGSNITDLFAGLDPDVEQGYMGSRGLSALNAPFQNVFQAFYHLVRRDLGVILDNQIYNSPAMFNKSITPVAVPEAFLNNGDSPFGVIGPSAANTLRAATSNGTLMAEWQDSLLTFSETDRVPVLEYLRPIPRLKPLGSAMTSVFVSTFAMVSTVWTIFSIVARAFVRSSDESTTATENLNLSLYESKHSLEGFEATSEASSLTTAYNDPIYRDGHMASLINRINRVENELLNLKRDRR